MGLAENLNAVIDAALESRIVGCVVLVRREGRLVYSRAAGFADREQSWPVKDDTIFRLASVTKPIVAATALRMLDLGLLSLDDTVAKYLPYFTPCAPDGAIYDITIRQLLTHTSGITYDTPDDVSHGSDPKDLMPLTENLRRLSRGTLAFVPGSQYKYGMSIDVLGGILAAINKSDLEGVVAEYVTGPLHMADTHFGVTDKARLAHPYADATPRPIRMAEPQEVINEFGASQFFSPRRILHADAPQSGGSGMAGTAGDFMKLLEALLGGFLKPATRDAAFSNQMPGLSMEGRPGEHFGFIGAVVEDAAASGWHKDGLIEWGGIWGNSWILDPAARTSVVAFTNTMREGCNGPFRDEIRDAVFG